MSNDKFAPTFRFHFRFRLQFSGVFAYFAVVLVYCGGLKAAKKIHNDLLHIIIRGSVCRFFDVTPMGRLMNHFSGDMDVIDEELPGTMDSFMTFIFMVFPLVLFISFSFSFSYFRVRFSFCSPLELRFVLAFKSNAKFYI